MPDLLSNSGCVPRRTGFDANTYPHFTHARIGSDEVPAGGYHVFWFYVAPYGQDRWILLSQDHPAGCTYESEGAAIRIAARAAELSYSRNGESAGVKVEHHGRWRTAIAYGSPEVSQHVGGPMRYRGEFVLGVQRISPPQLGSAPSEPFGQMKG